MRKTPGLSTALAIAVLSLLSGGQPAWAQKHPPLEHKGGPVLSNFKIYSLYWGQWTPAQIKAQQAYLKGLAGYISGVGSPKGEEPMLRQYGVKQASVTGYAKANPKAVKSLSKDEVVNIIKNNAGKLPAFDADTLIIVFLGKGSSLTTGPGRAYHHSESNTAFWAAVPQNAGPTLALVTAHEVFEAATDPGDDNSKGWISANGSEAVDQCSTIVTLSFGQIPGAADNTQGGTCSKTGYIPTQTKATIAVNDVTNECGGTLYVSGSGFTPGEQVHITVKNAPGLKSPQKIGTAVGTVNKQGKVSIQIPYSGNPYSGLPGCGKGSTAQVVVTIVATDESGHEASTEIYMRNCGITWGACPA
ncbi:MAG TPA: hypothetical protein VE825_01015 [Terriglobales bacterium]|jgi:hypothetical protein|nr:hypothetical protein [Terriglobales bacterium]